MIVPAGLIFQQERAGVKLLIVLLRRARQMESPGPNDFDVAAVNEELAHILASEQFTNAVRMRSFLSYIVSETLVGRAERIKSYSIAIEVFHRGVDFDASMDPIVRTTANRLRSALERCNQNAKSQTGIRISLPRGRYVPVFTAAEVPAADKPIAYSAHIDVAGQTTAKRTLNLWQNRGYLAIFLLLFAGLIAVLAMRNSGERPTVKQQGQPVLIVNAVEPLTNSDAAKQVAEGMTQLLVSHLAAYGNARIIDNRQGEASSVASDPAKNSDVYNLKAQIRQNETTLSVVWQLDDIRSKEVAWASIEDLPPTATFETAVDSLAGRSLGMEGAIPTIIGILYDGTQDQRGCLTKPQRLALIYHSVFQSDVMQCLEEVVTQHPNNAEAWAILAQIYYRLARRAASFGEDTKSWALKLEDAATQARILAPNSLLTDQALMYLTYNNANLSAFEKIARNILRVYKDPHLKIRIGNAFMNIGLVDEGVNLVKTGIDETGDEVGLAFLSLAYREYYLGNYTDALSLIERVGAFDYYLVPLIRTIIYAKLHRLDDARQALAALQTLRPDYERHLYGDFRHNNVSESVIDSIAEGLALVGVEAKP